MGESEKKETAVGEAVLHTAASSFLQGFWSASGQVVAPNNDEGGGSSGAAGGGEAGGGEGGGGAGWRLLVRIGALYSLFCMHFCGNTKAPLPPPEAPAFNK